MSAIPVITDVQALTLEALVTFRFLTVGLLKLWGVGSCETNIREGLHKLERLGWVGGTALTSKPNFGRLARLYFLKPAGAAEVGRMFGITPPVAVKEPPKLRDELHHRLAILETHIRLRQWAATAGTAVNWFTADYDPGRTRFLKATGTPYRLDEQGRAALYPPDQVPERPERTYTPDAIAQVTPPDGKARLLVIEVYRGGRGRTLKHFQTKLAELRQVCDGQLVEDRYGNPRGARFLVLFMDAQMRDAALSWWGGPDRDPKAETWEQFFVKDVPSLGTEFGSGWHQPGRPRQRDLFLLA